MTEPVLVEEAPITARRVDPRLIVVAAVLGVLLLGYLLVQVLGGGGDGSDTDDTAARRRPIPRAAVPTTTTTTAPVVETFEVFQSRNPFDASGTGVRVGTGGTATTGGSAGGSTTRPSTGTAGAPTGTTTGGPTGTTSGGTSAGGTTGTTIRPGNQTTSSTVPAGSAPPRSNQRVALLDVYTEAGATRANVRVNDTVYRVGEGETFATSYRVLSLSTADGCGRFVFGDDQFRLCRGEEVVK